MLNQIVIMGRLTRDPELRRTQAGIAVASWTLAVERDYADRNTGRKAVDFPKFEAWRQTAEFVQKWFTKGRMMAVKGSLESREWTDKEGKKHVDWVVNVEKCFFCGDKGDADSSAAPQNDYQKKAPRLADFAELDDDDSELPFV